MIQGEQTMCRNSKYYFIDGNKNKSHLGIKALASSAVSGHKLAKHASSNLWSFFLPSKLQQEMQVQKQQALQPILVFSVLKNKVKALLLLQSSMLDFLFIIWVKLPVLDRIYPQSNKFATCVETKATDDSQLTDGPGIPKIMA